MPNKLTTQSQRDILPTNVKPTHYDLVIRPDLKKFEFTGNVSIKINILQPTKQIKLNGKEIVINSAVIDGPEKQFFSEVGYDEEKEEITLSFPKELPPSTTALLTIEFTGIINDKLVGFYRSSFDDPNNNKNYLAVTHFEPTDARRVFPCWDEPNLKATFDITMIVDPELTALSNMHAVTEKVESGKKHIKFATSPVMSTYLVAFAVGPLEYVESKNQNGTLVRVYTTPGISYQGRFALDCACRTLDFFTEYFGIPYPMQKMDMIAIPDFSMGAMENWGLVTYRTTALLFDPKQSTTKTKQRIAYVVGHELAHQWFGNLVTMDWWTDLWLNEGFATWAGTLATDFLFPEWKIWTEFIVDDLMRGLQLDSLRSSHPIEVDVKNPAEINQIFDAISYSKGASVIRMLVSYLGEETFKLGIRKYLKRFEFRNATTKDLWEALEEQSKKPVKEMMTSWTRHIGYPIVKVERESCCCLRMTQNRYLSTGDVAEQENSTLWQIPLGLVVEGNAQPNAEELSTKSKSVEIGKDRFIKINKNSCGFFRTFYEKELMQNIGKAILDGKLPPEDRIGIINDAFNLAYSGHHDATVPLGLMQNFSNESNYMVWLELSSRLSELKSVWWEQDEQVQEGLKELICELCDGQVKSLGFDYRAGEDDIVGLLRVLILAMASRNNHQGVIEECKKRFSSFSNGNENAIHPDLRGIVFASVVKYGDVEEFDKVLEIYRQTKTVDQKLAALRALSFSQHSKLNTRFIEMSLNGEVRNQDVAFVIAYASSNFKSRRLTWEFVKNNWTKFYDTFYAGSSVLLGRVVSYSTENFTTEKDSAAVKQFFMDKNVTAIDRSIQQSIEKINCASNLLKRDSKPVAQWVLAHVKSRNQKS